jgi:hypothetical protein
VADFEDIFPEDLALFEDDSFDGETYFSWDWLTSKISSSKKTSPNITNNGNHSSNASSHSN